MTVWGSTVGRPGSQSAVHGDIGGPASLRLRFLFYQMQITTLGSWVMLSPSRPRLLPVAVSGLMSSSPNVNSEP